MKITLELDDNLVTEIEDLLEFRKEDREGNFTKPTVQEVIKKTIISIVNRQRTETVTAEAIKKRILLREEDIII